MGLNLSRSAILLLAAGDDLQRVVRQRPLHRQSFGSIRGQPLFDFGQRRQNDRYGFGMDRRYDGVGGGREETEQLMQVINRRALWPSDAAPGRP